MNWFLDPIKNQYADFSGRTSRKAFWMYMLFYVLFYVLAGAVGALFGAGPQLALLFSLVVLIPGVAISARRLHDTGMSGWFQLLGLIPFFGLIVMIVLLVRKGDAAANEYGPNPEGSSTDQDAAVSVPEVVASEEFTPETSPAEKTLS